MQTKLANISVLRILTMGLLLHVGLNRTHAQTVTDNQIKTGFVFSFLKYITWEKESLIDTFKIVVYGDDAEFISVLRTMEKQQAKNKPIRIILSQSLANIEEAQMLVVTADRNFMVKDIYELFKGRNTLLVTQGCEYKRYVMINFESNGMSKVQFEINSKNIEEARLKTSPKLVVLGGSEIDVRKLYAETEKSLNTAQEKAVQYEKELEQKRSEVLTMGIKLQQLNNDIEKLQSKISVQRTELSSITAENTLQQAELDAKQEVLDFQKREINSRENKLQAKVVELALAQKKVFGYNKLSKKLEQDISERKFIIAKQTAVLNSQLAKMRTQQNFMYLLTAVVVMAFVLIIVIYRNFVLNRRKNLELESINLELNESKNEILLQATQLEYKNFELEKLSLVASRTDNAVVIMNANGDFEWVNEGFSRFYGYTLEQYVEVRGNNLKKTSSYPYIEDIFITLYTEKKSVAYESSSYSSARRKLWTHATITPILDDDLKIRKLILIDSDITLQKETELAIVEKNEEIQRQSEELYEQTEQLMHLNSELEFKKSKLEDTLDKLKNTQSQLVSSEKMVILGQLTAGIAHEINNPINFINSGIEGTQIALNQLLSLLNLYSQIDENNVQSKLTEIKDYKLDIDYDALLIDIEQIIADIKGGIHRTIEIVKGLRTFSRLDESDLKTIDLHQNIDSTLVILRNKFNNRITIQKQYGQIPHIECYPGKINQVLLNIIVNAIQAITGEGFIHIATQTHVHNAIEGVLISIADSGMGMTNEIQRKIFEPFYTTKEAGEGTGLGLSISFSIIDSHQGNIEVVSAPAKGTTFKIFLPVMHKKKPKPATFIETN